MDAQSIIDAAISGNMDAFKTAFDSAIAAKVTDALDVKKVEIASTLLGTEEVPNESETTKVEVDGAESNDVGSTVDASSEDA
jgi:hypothetical protein